jgi:small-conductance mechanosensitive channel
MPYYQQSKMASLTETLQQLLNINNGTAEILASIIIFAVVAFVGWGLYLVIGRYFSKWTQKTETTLDDDILAAVKTIIIIMVVILGIEYALSPLSFLEPYNTTLNGVFLVIQILLSAFAVTRVSNIIADWYVGRTVLSTGKNSHHLLFILKKVIQVIVFVCAIIIILYALNVQDVLTGTLLGLGVGGIAIAFALQSTLSEFFSAFSIYFDHPFEIGDFIVVGDFSGTVKNIGIRSTRLQLLQGEELVISNKELTSTSVRNFRKLEKRRVTFNIGVTYDTSVEKLKKIPGMIKDIFDNVKAADLDRVNFTEFGDFSLKFLVIYYVNSADYGEYLDTQQKINFAIKEGFEHEGIEMAFPTSTIYVKK